jgi:hypothetical protein
MSGLTIMKTGNHRIIIFTGDIAILAQAIHNQALSDPAFSRAVVTAAVAIKCTEKSVQIGEEMCRFVNHSKIP